MGVFRLLRVFVVDGTVSLMVLSEISGRLFITLDDERVSTLGNSGGMGPWIILHVVGGIRGRGG